MSIRTERVANVIKEGIANILEREFTGAGLITVTDVRVSDDLKNAKIYISVFLTEGKKEDVIKKLNFEKKQIKFALGKKIYLKYMPEIYFYLDESIDKAERIENIFKQIHKDESN
jgi:ribosome-binding factor A